MKKQLFILALLLTGCASYSDKQNSTITRIQLLDRNGFSETISSEERLAPLQKINFLSSQPYQKILRVFSKPGSGTSSSKITTYHSNGQIWQYLEIQNGRAHGKFQEWYPNGILKIEATVIEGTPDINEAAQLTWVFEGKNFAYSDNGIMLAQMNYEKGSLEGVSYLYYTSGEIKTILPYYKNELEGTLTSYNLEGETIETTSYKNGIKEGEALTYWNADNLCSQEHFSQGLLQEASYFQKNGELFSTIQNGKGKQALFKNDFLEALIEYQEGRPEGRVEIFSKEGKLHSLHHIKEFKKYGEEIEYFADGKIPKLSIEWEGDLIEGNVKTWYSNGILESQKEIHKNKRNGLSFAWYKTGDLMLMEEYEEDTLVKGSYFKKREKTPVSKIENGNGVATLFDGEGYLLKKISYQKGEPQL